MGTPHWRHTVDEFVAEALVIPLTVVRFDELRDRPAEMTLTERNHPRILSNRGAHHDVTQAQAGEILGVKPPHVSLLMRNRSRTFSVKRLMDFRTTLGHDVEIRLKRTRKPRG